MRRLLLALALALSPFAAGVASAEPWQLERSDVLQVRAPDGHVYQVLVAWPVGTPPPQGWPVLWVLDGGDNFAIAATTARRLARAQARSGVGPGLIVAIDSVSPERRSRDYSPAVPGYTVPQGAPAAGLPIGGGEAFLTLLEQQVRPEIARRWRVDPARQTLLGHSFGGLISLHALLTGRWQGDVVAISPSLWYGNGLLEREASAFPAATTRRTVFIASGDERIPEGQGSFTGEALAAGLAQRGLAARYRALPGFDHGTTMLASIGDAIRVAFGVRQETPAR